ncbi:dihydropteroate synthase [Catenovulum sp. 2E275]|uniref:dihydropteroate synthase n=1 Tax=Catenovulum sp. 2E275 TaxID=2980497 RepID=UPI0021D2579F|nr:dihydropteroate synthase [Catenovulum sp. 2E275]MCU4676752.1 dihydropteroate synthase [Catenovulum sp. 2E275]
MKIKTLIEQSNRPLVMGIVNLTPDSFSDGGKFNQLDAALKQVEKMQDAGVDILDLGGESTRPGATYVEVEEERRRVIPAIQAIQSRFDIPISVDTYKPEIMQDAIELGVELINDIRALEMPGALEVLAKSDTEVCLMHMQGNPVSMQVSPSYDDVIHEVYNYLLNRIQACESAGIGKNRIILDPGFGFGKTVEHNYQLLAKFELFKSLDCPLLAGLSRKSMLGAVVNKEPAQRVSASVAGAVISALNGANIIRVHDVAETIDALKVVEATLKGEK